MSVHTIHSSETGTAIPRHTHDDGREGLLGTPAAAHGLGALALAAGYYATAQLGEALGFPNAPVSALWLSNALVMGALLIAPRRYWWLYLLAVLPAHLIAQLPLPDVAPLRALIQYVLNIGTAFIGAFALAQFEPGTHRFDRVLPAWRLVFFGGLVAPFTTSVLMAGVFLTTDVDRGFWMTTVVRALTNTFAILTVVPLMVHIADRLTERRQLVDVARLVEGAVLAICLAGASVAALLAPPFESVAAAAMLCLPLPMLLWAGIIAALVALSVLTAFAGLVLVFPLLGLASWRAYRDLVEDRGPVHQPSIP